MDRLSPECVGALHAGEGPVLSQHLATAGGACVWNVTLIGDAPGEILDVISDSAGYRLARNGVDLAVGRVEILPEITERELCLKYLVEVPPQRAAAVRFVTPCSFKSAGEYAILPTKELILQSCINRWNAASRTCQVDDEQAIADIASRVRITAHRLRSASYDVKGTRIPSFMGGAVLSARGPEPLLRLFNLLMAFGGLCGVGIKTALGMGGVEVALGRAILPPSAAKLTAQ
jgi:CRISPR-associated endoribonuclease Cas6